MFRKKQNKKHSPLFSFAYVKYLIALKQNRIITNI